MNLIKKRSSHRLLKESIETLQLESTDEGNVPVEGITAKWYSPGEQPFISSHFDKDSQQHSPENRFESLLRARLLSTFEQRPPLLFPWEAKLTTYPEQVNEAVSDRTSAVGSQQVAQPLDTIAALLPEAVLSCITEQCQQILKAPIKMGRALVKAVTPLFAEDADMLEPIAEIVLVPAYRSARSDQQEIEQALASAASRYDTALPEQKIAISMLVVREILSRATLTVSPTQANCRKERMTEIGMVTVNVTLTNSYCLEIYCTLPCAGMVCIRGDDMEQQATRHTPGSLTVERQLPDRTSSCYLEVRLVSQSKPYFVFSINAEVV